MGREDVKYVSIAAVVAAQALASAGFAQGTAVVDYEALVFCHNDLVAGGFNNHDFLLNPGTVAGFMTTPKGTLFSSPDTIVEVRNSADTLITENDDAGTDAVGGAQVGPTRGSMVRYGVTTQDIYSFRVRGFSSSDAGDYGATFCWFTPGGASDFVDTESNDTAGTAQAVSITAGEAKLGFGFVGADDQDFFRINVNAGDIVSAFTIPTNDPTTDFSAVDTLLDVRDSSGAIIITNDDAGDDAIGLNEVGPTRGSTIRYQATSSGSIILSVRGFNSASVGSYALVMSICPIPAPGAAALLGLGGLVAIRRRR
jgi:hypothetical protein